MIVKFLPRGNKGTGSRGSGPIDYLVGRNRDRELATVLRGDPELTKDLINSSKYKKTYTSGVLSFEEPNLSEQDKAQIMESYEAALMPGLEKSQYNILWVEHLDKGRLELNFVIPNLELNTMKRLQPYYHAADVKRIDAWKQCINHSFGLSDPHDPSKAQLSKTAKDLPVNKKEAKEAITQGLISLVEAGEIKSRQDVISTLEREGFEIARIAKKSISIKTGETTQNLRLSGLFYDETFRFGEGLREEIEANSRKYRASSEERFQQARDLYIREFRGKFAENTRRHRRGDETDQAKSAEELALSSIDCCNRDSRMLGNDSLPGNENNGEPGLNRSAAKNVKPAAKRNEESQLFDLREQDMCANRRDSTEVQERFQSFKEKLTDDGIRENFIIRARGIAQFARKLAERICRGSNSTAGHVSSYVRRTRSAGAGSEAINTLIERVSRTGRSIERAGRSVEQASRSVEQSDKAISGAEELVNNQQDRGLSL